MTEFITQFHFLRPQWFWALCPVLFVFGLCWQKLHTSEGWQKVISPDLLPFLLDGQEGKTKCSPVTALLITWIIAVIALAGPSWEKQNLPVYQRLDALVIIQDLSLSMYSDDIKPSRITRARHKLLDILKQRNEGMTALVAYAGDSHIVSPLTDDNATIANLIPAMVPAIMPLPGSEPVAAVETALSLFKSAAIESGRILLISDGITKKDIKVISKQITSSNFQLSILGVGTTEGAPIPIGNGELLKGPGGEIIIPKLSRSLFKELANKTRGKYREVSWDDSDTVELLNSGLNESFDETISSDRRTEQWHDSGYWLIFLMLPACLLSFRRDWLLAISLMLFPVDQTYAFEWQDLWYSKDQQGAKAMQQGQSEKASELFENENWAGTAHYKSEKYQQAAELFKNGNQAGDYYNWGNALAKQGDYENAKQAYDKALELDPSMEDAQFNKTLIEEIEKQQQSQQNQSQGDEHNSEQEDQKDKQQQGESDHNKQQQGQNQQDQPAEEHDPNQQSEQNSSQSQQQNQADTNKDKEQQSQQQQAGTGEDQENSKPPQQQTSAAQEQDGDKEKQQATEQWLRRVPDDPSGLLRRKFEYESKQQNRTNNGNDKPYW